MEARICFGSDETEPGVSVALSIPVIADLPTRSRRVWTDEGHMTDALPEDGQVREPAWSGR